MMRLGYGIGLGSGYYNLHPRDSYIHSLSAKGVKSKYRGYPKTLGHAPYCECDMCRETSLDAFSSSDVARSLTMNFTTDEIRVLKESVDVNFSEDFPHWSASNFESDSNAVARQLNIEPKKARKLVKRYLDSLEIVGPDAGKIFLGIEPERRGFFENVFRRKRQPVAQPTLMARGKPEFLGTDDDSQIWLVDGQKQYLPSRWSPEQVDQYFRYSFEDRKPSRLAFQRVPSLHSNDLGMVKSR